MSAFCLLASCLCGSVTFVHTLPSVAPQLGTLPSHCTQLLTLRQCRVPHILPSGIAAPYRRYVKLPRTASLYCRAVPQVLSCYREAPTADARRSMFVVLYDYVVAGQVGGLPALQGTLMLACPAAGLPILSRCDAMSASCCCCHGIVAPELVYALVHDAAAFSDTLIP